MQLKNKSSGKIAFHNNWIILSCERTRIFKQ